MSKDEKEEEIRKNKLKALKRLELFGFDNHFLEELEKFQAKGCRQRNQQRYE